MATPNTDTEMNPRTNSNTPPKPRRRKVFLKFAAVGGALALLLLLLAAQSNPATGHFEQALASLAEMFQTSTNAPQQTFVTEIRIVKADGLPEDLLGQKFDLALQAPDRLRLAGNFKGSRFVAARDGQQLWLFAPEKSFGLLGDTNIPLFSAAPEGRKGVPLGPFALPLPSQKLAILPLLMKLEALADEQVGNTNCHVIKGAFRTEAYDLIEGLPKGTFHLWLREVDSLPLRVEYADGKTRVQLELAHPQRVPAWPDSKWKLPATQGDQVVTVARAHLERFLKVVPSLLGERPAPLGPATGERRVVSREGKGRLEMIDGTQVLFLRGSPEEIGMQHGKLLKSGVRSVVDRILYGVGVGSSFQRSRWFFGEIESAEKRLLPFMDERYLREMDFLADAAGLEREEMRLANLFPELFHCTGFALLGQSTKDGHVYHGRILDYMKGIGLEANAVVMVIQPDRGHSWVNVSYAGFVGSVTAMNDQHIAIGELGGRGEGNWDGKPMAQLVREVMEKASSLDEAVAIMRDSPRTCEYYYVISDGKTKQAVGIKATPKTFEVVQPGGAHPDVRIPVKDAVLFSGGERLVELTRRVQKGWGTFDADSARDLMTRPVAMKSNIHSVLFRPDTLDFWVANADGVNVASHARYTLYNLAALLQPETQ